MTVPRESLDMAASFFLGCIVKGTLNDLTFWDLLGCPSDDRPPELPSAMVEGAPQEHREL